MRLALALICALPTAAQSDVFKVASRPTAVTVYSGAAEVTRDVQTRLPAGAHEVILPDLPIGIRRDQLKITVDGAVLRNAQFSAEPTVPDSERPEIIAAKARVKAAEQALQELDDRIAATRLTADAAKAKMDFLSGLNKNEALPSEVETLRALAQMIGSETLSAQQETLQAEQSVRTLNEGRGDLEENLRYARQLLKKLRPTPEERLEMTLSVTAAEEKDILISVTYFVEAYWQPIYDVYLSSEVNSQLEIQRKAGIQSYSDEAWENVTLSLSTLSITERISPREVVPQKLIFGDQLPGKPMSMDREPLSAELDGRFADTILEVPVIIEERSVLTSFDGPGVTYTVSEPVSTPGDNELFTVSLDELSFDARRFARAVPRLDDTAFLMALFTNETQEPLLAAEASIYLDNTLIGQTQMDTVPAGAEAELPFGPIHDLQLSYAVLDETEGDRGIISRSNTKTEQTRLDIQNIGNKDWDIEVLSAVPYAVQEDLIIDWTATPAPNSENVNDKTGVLQWDISVRAGTTSSIAIDKDIRWPEGKILR